MVEHDAAWAHGEDGLERVSDCGQSGCETEVKEPEDVDDVGDEEREEELEGKR